MNQTASPQTSPAAASAERGRAQVNPQPKRAYRITLTLKDAPGAFALVEGRAQYDVTNEAECGHVDPAAGVAERITSNEPFTLTKVSDTEYEGTVYLDLMQDQDYYGRGVVDYGVPPAWIKVTEGTADSGPPGIDDLTGKTYTSEKMKGLFDLRVLNFDGTAPEGVDVLVRLGAATQLVTP